MNKVMAMILAGGRGDRLSILSEERAKPAVVFGGKYRIIDFTLSNCVNSGIYRVALLTQYRPRSLNDHVGIGRPWDLDRSGGGVVLLQPYIGRSHRDWYKNTADAVYQNINFIEESKAEQVLILSGDHVYRMRYDQLVSQHRARGADCTVCVATVPIEEASRFGVLTVDTDDAIVDFAEKPQAPRSNLVSMGIYVFNRDTLIARLKEDAQDAESTNYFGRDIIPGMIGGDRMYAFQYNDFWMDIGTVDAYWRANMELVSDLPRLNLFDRDNPVFTKPQNRGPAKTGPQAQVIRSVVCEGCIINGVVRNSVLSPGVFIDDGAVVDDAILFDDCYVGPRSYVHKAIVDKEVRIGAECHVGWSSDYTPNKDEPDHLSTGITLVGKGARIPPHTLIGRNCKIYPGAQDRDFPSDTVPSGETVRRPEQ